MPRSELFRTRAVDRHSEDASRVLLSFRHSSRTPQTQEQFWVQWQQRTFASRQRVPLNCTCSCPFG
eukprot:7862738-Karenia_brevis.AAC.1